MEFYNNINNDIISFYNSDTYTELLAANISINTIAQFFKTNYKYPLDISILIIENKKLFLKIIDRFRKIIIESVENNFSFKKTLKIINKLLIIELDTEKKKLYNRFQTIIKDYLTEKEWFINIYNNIKPPTEDLLLFQPNLLWCRPNQKISIETSLKNNFESGIDLHATGGGKTYTILAKAFYYNQLFNKNVILMCEKKYILNNEFANLNLIDKNIIDINKINIINLSTNPNKNFYEKIEGTNNLIIVNRSYISHNYRFKLFTKNHNIGLILVDECHSSSANKTFEILEYFKSLHCNIIGFSATPIRNTKLNKYIQLFGYNNKINYLCNYSLFNAIIDYDPSMKKPFGCLPFKICLYNNEDKKPEKIFEIICENLQQLHYKKIIIWFRKIDTCNQYYNYFNVNTKMQNIKLYISHNQIDTNISDSEFINRESNCIMFCVNRFREGTNLNTLELGFLLDSDINRGDIPTIQMCGRLVRFEDTGIKKYGTIIDFCSKSNILEKIIKYYIDLTNDNHLNKIIEFIKLNIEVLKDKKQINIKLDKNKQIELVFKSIEINWDNIKNELIDYVTSSFKYNIYRVPIGSSSLNNYIKSIKNLEEPIWGCKEELVKKIKVNDKLIFEIDNKLEIYNINKISIDPNKSYILWNDLQYSKILYLSHINSIIIDVRYKFLNKLIGYKELFIPRTIILITNFTEDFINWFELQINKNDDDDDDLIL
jgi:superfamily II DNA or RNA helicase